MIQIKYEAEGVKETLLKLTGLQRFFRDVRPFWGDVARIFYESERRLFETQGGGAWAPLSPRYLKRKMREYPQTGILERTGALRRSLTSPFTPNSVYEPGPLALNLGTNLPYYQYHARGTRRMPARPPIIITESEAEAMAEVVRDGLKVEAARLGLEVK